VACQRPRQCKALTNCFCYCDCCLKRRDRFGLVIARQSFGNLCHGILPCLAAPHVGNTIDVRFGSKADMCSALGDVRFVPISGHPRSGGARSRSLRNPIRMFDQAATASSFRFLRRASNPITPGSGGDLRLETFCVNCVECLAATSCLST
jgi:hypothetical protein